MRQFRRYFGLLLIAVAVVGTIATVAVYVLPLVIWGVR